MAVGRISVYLADDNLIVREGVRALLEMESDIEIVGTADDYEGLIAGADGTAPQVVVTDIRMPPSFRTEGLDAAVEVRKRHPGTGIVILSQYEEPEYAISLLDQGAAGVAYLLKDRVADGDQLAQAVREVATGGSMLDPRVVGALVSPVTDAGDLTQSEEELLELVAKGKPIKAIAVRQRTTPALAANSVEKLFLKLARKASSGRVKALGRIQSLHQAIIDREEQGEALARLLPGGLTEKLREEGHHIGRTELLDVTVLMSDVRGYSSIAEAADPSSLAGQLGEHRAAMSQAILETRGTIMQFVGDAVMGVFGAPSPQSDHADQALAAANRMHSLQANINRSWAERGLPPFLMGIGLSTGTVAGALLGSVDRLEYSVVGDSVNLAQRLQQWANEGETVLSQTTYSALGAAVEADRLEPARVKGRQSLVHAYRIPKSEFADDLKQVVSSMTGENDSE
ncbi:MAG TPA: adenylate/guanylate cyclase domain-containing protein [Actinomycetota bacterium]|nr:adenylate/guanylate cyclase domain-containing protein [Actinomycetota bacterium]